MNNYEQLKTQFKEIGFLNRTIALLDWDHETYLPAKGVNYRADQQAFLSGMAHNRLVSTRTQELIEACESNQANLSAHELVNIREWRKDYDRSVKLPTEFVERFEKNCSLAKASWAEARRENKFELFSEHLGQIIELSRQKAEYYGYDQTAYDALMDVYEPGCTTESLTPIFADLKKSIVDWLPEAIETTRDISADFLKDNYPLEGQKKLNEIISKALGFDFESGRIDATTHPFCTELGPHDVRLTTRYEADDFTVSLYSVLHEAGHGLYEQGFKSEHTGTPMAESVSLGIHESQSRLWENKVGRAPEFWNDWHSIACEHLPALKRFTPEQLTKAVNRVSPSFIRVEADEVTYDLHIILRYELEKALIAGDIKVNEIPGVWNEQFKAMFGLEVPDDTHGCLQDIHWSMGGFGYFPTYSLGNLNSAQLYASAEKKLGSKLGSLQNSNYHSLLEWLRKNVHQYGKQYSPDQLMQNATGESTKAHYHWGYLKDRFSSMSQI